MVGCVKDLVSDQSNQQSTTESVALSFSSDSFIGDELSSTTTRATTDIIEDQITDMWLMMFDSNGDRIDPDPNDTEVNQLYHYAENEEGELEELVRMGKNGTEDEIYGSTYIEDYEVGSTIYVNKELSAKIASIRVVGNTEENKIKEIKTYYVEDEEYSENFTSEWCKTIDEFEAKYFRLEDNSDRETDMWYTYEKKDYLRLAGSWDGEIPETGLDFNLSVLAKPMAAKISVTYTCEDYYPSENGTAEDGYFASVTVSSVQIIHVPVKCYFKDVNSAEKNDHEDFTSYQPQYSLTDDRLGYKSGEATFYVPQNMQGDVLTNTSESDKSDPDNAPTYATKVIIAAVYKHFDEESMGFVDQNIYIQLYPGEAYDNVKSYQNYDIKMRRHFHIVCNISADKDDVKWESDCRVTLDESLPDGPIVRYEFRTDDLSLNSAYDADENLLGDYPRTDGSTSEAMDNVRTSYLSGYDWMDYRAYELNSTTAPSYTVGTLPSYYDRYFYGFVGTTNVVSDDDRPFLRNLAPRKLTDESSDESPYDEHDNHTGKKHPEVFDCTFIKDNRERYNNIAYTAASYSYAQSYLTQYPTGELKYTEGNNYISASLVQLLTGWGTGEEPSNPDEEFTIVFIGSVGSNKAMSSNVDRAVYYGNSLEWNNRWYFYRADLYSGSYNDFIPNGVTYGFGELKTQAIDALTAETYQNVQSYDVCGDGQRKVYFNNVDVDGLAAEQYVPGYNSSTTIVKARPRGESITVSVLQDDGTYEDEVQYPFILESPISIFGHTSEDNYDDAIDAKLRLFMIYDRALTLTEIDQIRRYAALHDLLLFGAEDYTGFEITVTPETEPAWDSESDWTDGGGGNATIE